MCLIGDYVSIISETVLRYFRLGSIGLIMRCRARKLNGSRRSEQEYHRKSVVKSLRLQQFPRLRELAKLFSDCQCFLNRSRYLWAIRIIFPSFLRRVVKHSMRRYSCELTPSFCQLSSGLFPRRLYSAVTSTRSN